ncbi:hypothetical protein [Paenibacillus sp. HJGM_3]|uniref:hypothetical protein n=1 Tax=Paenibacillus sp. HJGM_3 TaxID=3379816 RepID=UPI00385FAFFF
MIMTQTVSESVTGGAVVYAAGERYLVDDEKAAEWLSDGVAYDPDNPPEPEQELTEGGDGNAADSDPDSDE